MATLQKQQASYSMFINSIQSKATKKVYSEWLKEYMKYLNVTEYDDLLEPEAKIIQSQIIGYIMDLRSKHLSRSTINVRTSALKHFFEMNDILGINWAKVKKFKGEATDRVEDRPYKRQEIKLLVDNASIRDKAIILLMSSAGIRRAGITDLKVRDLLFIEKYNIFRITVYAGTPSKYYTFCTPECKKAIEDYLNWRTRLGEKITPEAPLFRKEFDITMHFKIRNHVTKLHPDSINSMVRDLSYNIGVKKVQHVTENIKPSKIRNQIMTTHGFRKFFATTIKGNGMDKTYSEMVMGHNIGLDKVYFKATWEEVLEGNDRMNGYVSVINDLTINEENRLKQKVKQLSEELSDLDQRINERLERAMNKLNTPHKG